MLHGAAAQFHQPTEHVHRESHAHILEAGDVPEQLSRLPPMVLTVSPCRAWRRCGW